MTEFIKPHTQKECEALGYAVYNPHDRIIDELPFIYGFNNGGSPGLFSAVLVAEDGTGLGSHICSDEGWMPLDLGVRAGNRPDRHQDFIAHYPDGYVMDFVSHGDVLKHPGLKIAFDRNNAKRDEAETSPEANP